MTKDTSNIRKGIKEEELLRILREKGPLTRTQLMEITGVPRTTLYDKLVKLILKGKVRKVPVKGNGRGRPKVYYEVIS
ncbi:MAG: helix-turn-helix domain-containing protein [Candidatus Baldrarchaeia archaeon]